MTEPSTVARPKRGEPELLPPDEVDEAFVARPVEGIAMVAFGDETVLVGGAGAPTVVNPTGALIWEQFDGDVSLGELIADLSHALGIDEELVRADVLAFARMLGEDGLLEGVGYPPPESVPDPELPAWVEPVPLQPGEAIEPFTLDDLDGTPRIFPEPGGRDALLVNWSPSCGYCTMIAGRLAELHTALAARDVDLVFLATGESDANREVFDAAGLTARALLLGDGVGPFTSIGTPAAYHVDADGTVAAPMALGAFDVPILAAQLAGVDPNDVADDPADHAHHGHDHDGHAGTGMCGAGATTAGFTDWAGQRAYNVGDATVTVQFNSDDTAATLEALLGGGSAHGDHQLANYSVALYAARGASSRRLNLLVQNGAQIVRSRSVARVLRALLWRVSDDMLGVDLESGNLVVDATAAVRGGDGILLPSGLWQFTRQLQPRFARRDIALADVPYPQIDLARSELVIPKPRIVHAASVLDSIDGDARLGSELPPVLPGRYPLAAWCMGDPRQPNEDLSPAVAAVAALPFVLGIDDERACVEQLGELFGRVRGAGIYYTSERELVDAVVSALR